MMKQIIELWVESVIFNSFSSKKQVELNTKIENGNISHIRVLIIRLVSVLFEWCSSKSEDFGLWNYNVPLAKPVTQAKNT